MPGLTQAIKGPQIALANREAGCPVAAHDHPAHVLQQALGTDEIGHEVSTRQIAGALMPKAMAGQLMPLADDAPDQLRIALGHPAQSEEGGVGGVLIEQGQNPIDIALDTAFTLIPLATADVGRHRRDLEIILDVNRQCIRDGSHFGPSSCGFFTALTSCWIIASSCKLDRSKRSMPRSRRCS